MSENKSIVALRNELPQIEAILSLNAAPGQDIKTLALAEISYLETIAQLRPALAECEPISVFLAVKTVLKQNLTLDPYAGLVYIKTRKINAGTQQSQNWKTVIEIQPSANGLISIARQCGRILDIKRPAVKKDEKTGKIISVSVEILLPSVPENRWETFEFDEDDFYRWARASHKENGRNKQDANAETMNYANENYRNFKGGIDPEFARAKAIRHALKKLGTNQNENRMGKITVIPKKEIVVDPKADENVVNDENQNGGYASYTEVSSEVKTTKQDLPKAEDL